MTSIPTGEAVFCDMRFSDFSATLDRRWPKTDLTWSAASFAPIGGAVVALARSATFAAAQWSHVSGLDIRHAGPELSKGDLHLAFFGGNHGDGSPFDGPGRVLAHGFYPWADRDHQWEGHIHFDETEQWILEPGHPGMFRLDIVALHEMGHALGLGHNPDDPGSVMYPYYRGVDVLSRDDIAGIQKLYGLPPAPPPVPGDEFNWHHERTEAWNYEVQWLFDALLAGRVRGTNWTTFRGRTVAQVLVDAPWMPPVPPGALRTLTTSRDLTSQEADDLRSELHAAYSGPGNAHEAWRPGGSGPPIDPAYSGDSERRRSLREALHPAYARTIDESPFVGDPHDGDRSPPPPPFDTGDAPKRPLPPPPPPPEDRPGIGTSDPPPGTRRG